MGGQAVQAARLMERLREEPSLSVDYVPHNPRLPGPLRAFQQVKYVRTVVTTLMYLWLLVTKIPSADVIHVFAASYFSFLLAPTPAVLIARLFARPAILNYHSGECEDHLRRWSRTALPTIRLFDKIVVPSGYLVNVFARFGLHARVISNFVDTSCFVYRTRRPLRPVFLSNRNFEPHYNVAMTLRAFKIIQHHRPDARLIVAGDGKLRQDLEQLSGKLGLRNVQFLGRVEQAAMPELYNQADIYLNSPNVDNMPVSVLEAYSSGIPVVTTNAGGIPFIVQNGKTGLIVPRGDHATMAAAAIGLLEDDVLATQIVQAGHEQSSRYTWQAVRHQWLRLYNDATAPSKYGGQDG